MLAEKFIKLKSYSFRSIYIIENRACWAVYKDQCCVEDDLILCVDLGLKNDLEKQGYSVQFVDHLVDKCILDEANFAVMNFLGGWYKDVEGSDLLEYNGYQIGEALLLNILNTVTYYAHFFFNINAIHSLKHKNLYISVQDPTILEVVTDLKLQITDLNQNFANEHAVYSFPISQWMNEKLNRTSSKERIKDFGLLLVDRLNDIIDLFASQRKTVIYIQAHHPTKNIIKYFQKMEGFRVLLSNYSSIKNVFRERRIPINDRLSLKDASPLLHKYRNSSRNIWEYDGYRISDFLYKLINPIIEEKVPLAISKIKSIEKYFSKHSISLMVPITHLWLDNKLIINYCQKNSIPVFTIINGLLNLQFWNDAKGGDYVNSYSQSIKEDYFKNASKALPLGDPRMDDYAVLGTKLINRETPTIVIGAAGFDLLDMNSYLSFEFDFLYDILNVLSSIKNSRKFKLVLKVRPNGYVDLYEKLVAEYFSDLQIEIIQNQPFNQVISSADLYLTFYSQTVFEASCIGVPVIYYKKDTQSVDRPFDGKSELVTANDVSSLEEKILAFYNNDPVFDLFLDKIVMERYIGPLDGKNTERNISFIKALIKNGSIK